MHLTLLEEPQAALYNWIDNSNYKWRDEVEVGDIVLELGSTYVLNVQTYRLQLQQRLEEQLASLLCLQRLYILLQ